MSDKLSFFVNGKKVEVNDVDPVTNLSTFLRNNLGLTGAKNGCGRGVCGACTVMISHYDFHSKKIRNFSVNACLYPLALVESCAITTVEGLGSSSKGLHPIQERFFKGNSSQCGFCTPGMIMSIYAMLRNNPQITSSELLAGLDGNLCRCTGYRSIVDSMSTFGSDCPCKDNNKKTNSNGTVTTCCQGLDKQEDRVPPESSKLAQGEELIFPSALQLNTRKSKHIVGDRTEVYLPVTLKEFVELKHKFPAAIILGANSTRIFERAQKGAVVISTSQVEELRRIEFSKEGDLVIGGASNFGDVLEVLGKPAKTTLFGALKSCVSKIGSTQVRNSSTLAGNLVLNDYNSDLVPLLICGNTKVVLTSNEGTREVDLLSFIKGPGARNVDLKEGEVISSIKVPQSTNEEYVAYYKVNTRETTSRSVVGAACKVRLDGENVADIRLTYCGVSKTVKRALNTERALIGDKWDHSVIEKALNLLGEEFFKDIEELGEHVEYRKSLVQTIFFKFFYSSFAKFKGQEDLFREEESPVVPTGTQTWEEGFKDNKYVGKSYTHTSGQLHTTGEAKYVGDIELPKGGLEAAIVYSTVPNGKILDIDTSEALQAEGVVAFYSAKDFVNNPVSPLTKRPLLPNDTVIYYGDPIGIIVADTHENALRAAYKVKVKYEELPAILDLDQAIKTNSLGDKFLFPVIEALDNGKVDEEFLNSNENEIFEGQYELGGAKHYYMEPHAVLVVPQEAELIIYSATQDVKSELDNASAATGVPRHRITVKTKRVGGSFGGKGGGGVYASVAVAANKLRRPVRLTVPRSIDTLVTSRRGIFRAKYKVAVSKKDNKIVAVDWDVQVDGGCGGFAPFLTNEVLLHLDNCYNFPNFRCNSKVYKTNRSMTMPMRGAGCPQGSAFVEFMIQDVAMKLKIDPAEFREKHLFQNGNTFVNHQTVEHCEPLHQAWKLLKDGQNYKELSQQVDLFNSKNRYKKRGISLSPVRYSIMPASFAFMYQGNALVHVNPDGTVMLSHDGIEVGQGINIKMSQICAEVFDIPVEDVFTPNVSTDQTTGQVGMGGSKDTERVGSAVKLACEEIKNRLDNLKKTLNKPEASFKELCGVAFLHRVPLASYGHYASPFDLELAKVHGFTYFTWANCLSVVEIDVLTGKFDILECHTVQDCGRSVNPSIDIGQIEGGFLMGLSWLTQEDLKFNPKNGAIVNQPEEYEIAGPQNIPQKFHVTILPNVENSKSVHSLKGIGEPPHSLPISVVCALKHAIANARQEINLGPVEEFFQTPLNRERIQLLCGNQTSSTQNKSENK